MESTYQRSGIKVADTHAAPRSGDVLAQLPDRRRHRSPPPPLLARNSHPLPLTACLQPAAMAPYACMHFRLPHIFPPQTLAPRLAVLLAASALLLLMPRPAAAHGFLAEPPARNLQRDWRNCPHCVNFGGTWPSSGEGRLRWPDTAQPVRRRGQGGGRRRWRQWRLCCWPISVAACSALPPGVRRA